MAQTRGAKLGEEIIKLVDEISVLTAERDRLREALEEAKRIMRELLDYPYPDKVLAEQFLQKLNKADKCAHEWVIDAPYGMRCRRCSYAIRAAK